MPLDPTFAHSPIQIAVLAPNNVGGSVAITITTDAGKIVSDDKLTVQIGPKFGPLGNQILPKFPKVGDVVKLAGVRFDGPNLLLKFNAVSTAAGDVISVTPTEIQVKVPAALAVGTQAKITVTTDNGTTTSERYYHGCSIGGSCMPDDLYPAGPTPLSLAAGATSALLPITAERVSATIPPTMFIRIAVSSNPSSPPTSATPPSVWLKADTGDEELLPFSPNPRVLFFNQPAHGGIDVGEGLIQPESNDLYLVTVLIASPGQRVADQNQEQRREPPLLYLGCVG